MKRRDARENAFLAAFELDFGHSTLEELLQRVRAGENEDSFTIDAFAERLLRLYQQHAAETDAMIEDKLRGWNSERLTRTSRSLLRLAVAELRHGETGMDSIIINEAVELAKKYGGDNDYRFVNGILGTISREKAVECSDEKGAASNDDAGAAAQEAQS